MARGSKRQPWSHYRGLLSEEAIQYMGYVSSASVVRIFQCLIVPGMLQTEDYTRALMDGAFSKTDEQIEEFVTFRAEYRGLLTQPNPSRVFFILDEAVIRRVVGGNGVMREQLNALARAAELPNVSIRILTYAAGAHPGLRGSFTYLSFPDAEDADVVYMENPLGEAVFKDEGDLTARYLDFFYDVEQKAAPAEQLGDYLQRALERLSDSDTDESGDSQASSDQAGTVTAPPSRRESRAGKQNEG